MIANHSPDGTLNITCRVGLLDIVRELAGCKPGDEILTLMRLPVGYVAKIEHLATSDNPDDEAITRRLLLNAISATKPVRAL